VVDHGIWVSLSRILKGFIHSLELSSFQMIRKNNVMVLGASLPVLVTSVDFERHRLQLSLRNVPEGLDRQTLPTTIDISDRTPSADLCVGQLIHGRIRMVNPPNPTSVQVCIRLLCKTFCEQ